MRSGAPDCSRVQTRLITASDASTCRELRSCTLLSRKGRPTGSVVIRFVDDLGCKQRAQVTRRLVVRRRLAYMGTDSTQHEGQ